MNLILSRKGFDSAAGGGPSPILPDGRMVSLPIPDAGAGVRYADLTRNGAPLGGLVRELTGGRITPEDRAHLDPDLVAGEMPRTAGWHPSFGQCEAAQSHLANQGVGVGDLFLYFGLFRETEEKEETRGRGSLRFKPGVPALHALWGWLRVGEVIDLDARREHARSRFHPHPHVLERKPPFTRNTLYVAAERLGLPGVEDFPGAGVCERYRPELRLTDPAERRASRWHLPGWFMPYDGNKTVRPPLSYHAHPDRWSRDGDDTLLTAVGRGQEFVLDADAFPETGKWLQHLFRAVKGAGTG